MTTPSKFVKTIRQKIIPTLKMRSSSSTIEDVTQEKVSEKVSEKDQEKLNTCDTKYVGIPDSDMQQRIQHTIRNLMQLDEAELAYIEDMNCRNMFEIVKLLNNVIYTLVENMMSIDN
jgi:hypothetical protein